jgi:hypothetical protein
VLNSYTAIQKGRAKKKEKRGKYKVQRAKSKQQRRKRKNKNYIKKRYALGLFYKLVYICNRKEEKQNKQERSDNIATHSRAFEPNS